jgi:predicted deacetylase
MSMLPKPAQYLLRFDDLCPTFDRAKWNRYLPLIEEFKLRPILSVVPENCDEALEVASADPDFWLHMRALQKAGATIGLHGYRHIKERRGKSLIPIHWRSEFAGIPLYVQQDWIQNGIEILLGHGLNPEIWVAPRHGFDRNTLQALRSVGITVLSDGFARRPIQRHGVTWIPMQLWEPAAKPSGLWTICVHPNTASDASVQRLHRFLAHHAPAFTSVERVLHEFQPARIGPSEWLHEQLAYARLRLRRARRRRRS